MDKALYDRGMAMRRKVLGDDFNRKFQDLLNEFCWGAVWTDEDLKPRDRSLLNLGMIACLGRMHEFEAHFRGALRNGLTPKELSAILRQVAIYCGFPAAVDCHRVLNVPSSQGNSGPGTAGRWTNNATHWFVVVDAAGCGGASRRLRAGAILSPGPGALLPGRAAAGRL